MKLVLSVGDSLEISKWGKCTVQQIDSQDREFTYLVIFEDGSRAWLSNWQVKREMKKHGIN